MPVGKWNFDEGSDGQTATGTNSIIDSSGSGNHGTPKGSPNYQCSDNETPGGQGCSLAFSGNSRVNIPYGRGINPSQKNSHHTYSAWVKSASYTSDRMFFSQSTGQQRAYLGHIGGYWSMGIQKNSWGNKSDVSADDKWHHAAMVFDGSSAKFYLDGKIIQQKSYTSYTFNQNFVLGSYYEYHNSFPWVGLIDDVRIYNQDLSLSQIQQLYAQGVKSHANLAINN